MDVKEVAQRAITLVEKNRSKFQYAELAMLRGFFRGVAEGRIQTGQSWLVDIIREEKFLTVPIEEEELKVIEDVAASGMLVEGQSLSVSPEKSFAARSGK